MFKRDNLVIKTLWLIGFLISAGWMVFMIIQGGTTYFKWETVIKTETIVEIPTKFPTVAICNANSFLTPYSIEFVQNFMASNNLTEATFFDNNFSFILYQFRYLLGSNLLAPSVPDSYKQMFGLPFQDMLLDCNYNLKNCTANDFEWYFDALFGNCYKFNGGKV